MNKGASFDIPALNKKVALHFAAEGGHVYACKALLELGADPMKTDKVSIHTKNDRLVFILRIPLISTTT